MTILLGSLRLFHSTYLVCPKQKVTTALKSTFFFLVISDETRPILLKKLLIAYPVRGDLGLIPGSAEGRVGSMQSTEQTLQTTRRTARL